MTTEEKVKKTLAKIIDPELGANIVSLGFVKDIKIEDGKVTIKLELTIPGCPLMGFFLEEIKKRVGEIEEVSSVEIELVEK